MNYTESQLRTIGGKRWLKRKWKSHLFLGVMCIVWVIATQLLLKQSVQNTIVAVAPVVLVLVNLLVSFKKAGQSLVNEVKSNPAIDLG